MSPVHSYAPRGVHPPYSPILVYASVWVWRLCMLWGVVMGSPLCWDTLLTPSLHPHTQSLGVPRVPCALVCFRDISMLCGHSLLSVRVWGCFSHLLGVEGASAHEMSICSFLYFFVVHYVSHFDYSSDYYSSSYSGVFWPVFCVISDSGSFLDRVSSKLGSAWCGSTTTLDAERL